MSTVPEKFTAFRIHKNDKTISSGFEQIGLDDLTAGEVVIKVAYSDINYKDALAATGKGRILRTYPLVGGIDLSGVVVSSEDARFSTQVIKYWFVVRNCLSYMTVVIQNMLVLKQTLW